MSYSYYLVLQFPPLRNSHPLLTKENNAGRVGKDQPINWQNWDLCQNIPDSSVLSLCRFCLLHFLPQDKALSLTKRRDAAHSLLSFPFSVVSSQVAIIPNANYVE